MMKSTPGCSRRRSGIAALATLAAMLGCATPPSGDPARPSGAEPAPGAAAVITTEESPEFSGDPRDTAVRVLVEAEAAHGRESPEAARARVALADLEFRLDIVRARALYLQSLAALRREAEDAPILAVVLQRLGRIDYLLGDLPSAITRAREALQAAERVFGAQHVRTAIALLSLAEIAHASGRNEQARTIADAVTELLAAIEEDDPGAALVITSPLGSLEGKLGRFERAEPLLVRGHAAAEARWGPDALPTAARLNDLAYVYARSGRLGEAAPLAERSVVALYAAAGDSSIPYALGLDTLGVVRTAQGRADEARELLESALAIAAPAFGRDSPVVLDVLEHYRDALADGGDAITLASVTARIDAAKRRRDERLNAFAAAPKEPTGPRAAPVFRSASFGYSVDLGDTEWSAWDRVAAFMPFADFGALYGDAGGFAVLPLSYFGTSPEPDIAIPALLALIQSDVPKDAQPIHVDGFEGVDFVTDRLRDGAQYLYRARALSGRQRGFTIVAWIARGRVADETAVLDAVERVRFDPQAPPAPVLSQLSESERTRHASFFNETGLRYAQLRRYGTAIDFLERATATSPDDPILFENMIRIEIAAGRYASALESLQTGVERFADFPRLRAYRAYAASLSGDYEAALADYERSFELGVDDEDLFENWIESLWQTGREKEAFERLDTRIAATHSRRLRVVRAILLYQSGRAEQAVSDLRELENETPGDSVIVSELVNALAAADRHREAIETSTAAIERFGPTIDLYVAKANSEYMLEQYEDAAQTLDDAIDLDPNNETLQQFAAHVAAQLGTGEQALIRAPIEAVRISEEDARFMAADDANDPEPGASSYDFWIEAIHYEHRVELRRTTHFRVKLESQRTVEQFTSLRIPFLPLAEQIFVNDVIVRDAEGDIVARGDAADYYVLDPPDEGLATSEKVLHIPVSGLQTNRTLEVRVSRRSILPPEGFEYIAHPFSRTLPIRRSAMLLSGDVDRVTARPSADVQHRATERNVMWWVDHPAPARWEPLLPRGGPDVPSIRLGESGASWRKVAQAYLAELEPLLEPDPEANAIADRVLASLRVKDDRTRIHAMAETTRQRLSYNAIEFGTRARIPQPVSATLARGYGDCKDHALLLQQLLRRAGVRAHLALVAFDREVDPELPALDQFDHMVVYCEACGAGFIDTTDKDFASDVGIPRDLAGAQALILEREHPRLIEIPMDDPANHFLTVERTVTLDSDGSAQVEEDLVFAGSIGAAIRRSLRSLEPSEWKTAFQQRLSGELPNSRIRSLEVDHIDTPDRALELALAYEVQDLFAQTARSLVGRLPTPWERALIQVPPAEARRAPFAFANPLRVATQVRVIAPEGHGFVGKEIAHHGGDRYLHWRATALPGRLPGAEGAQVDPLWIRYEFERPAGRYPADGYEAFFEESAGALRFLDSVLELEKFTTPR